ncbi:Rec8 like protein-domain-containing protein [Coprinopsis sp. MPI-PUGE-AT-0042]|nr:Rec8 like protein-domain-containing protein [Coprinopsis sp. MPI-PUGE-AT-0042]
MFFTPDLLAKRDSGFGLLWLAATLGSKSAFKKLPRRSVITADISNLCDLISQPAEPLALRLSSNLMFGVVRVYKVKQEIFLSDVTSCVTSLKKVVSEMNSKAVDARLELAQTSARPSAITINPDSRGANILDYDAFVTDWDEYLNIAQDPAAARHAESDGDDDAFNPKGTRKAKATRKRPASTQPIETGRQDAHTLDEHYEHLLTNSFEGSFTGQLPGLAGSGADFSSQAEPAIDFGGFDFSDAMDGGDVLGGLGDELAREIGWASPEKRPASVAPSPAFGHDAGDIEMPDFNFEVEMDAAPAHEQMTRMGTATPNRPPATPAKAKRNKNKENAYPDSVRSQRSMSRELTPGATFAAQFLSQNHEQTPALRDVTPNPNIAAVPNAEPRVKKKRTRLLLDARTELTDDELKIARAKYLQHQKDLRREVLLKRAEKFGTKLIDEYMWGAPKGIQDEGLAEFWKSTFKVQVDAQSGMLDIHPDGDDDGPPARKRQRTSPPVPEEPEYTGGADQGYEADMGMMIDDMNNEPDPFAAAEFRRSSEEPGQARRASRPSSVFGGSNLGKCIDAEGAKDPNGSQRSSLFPWDNAGAGTSSSGNDPLGRDDNIEVTQVEVRIRGSSRSRKSSVAGSQYGRAGTPQGGPGFSPIPIRLGSPAQDDGHYEFNVPEAVTQPEETQGDTQRSEENAIFLEKNSFNFLEYARMQSRTLPNPEGKLSFNQIVPPDTSTRHVAAAAFHHCLVLATKDLIRLEQEEPYGTVFMTIN